MKQELKNARVKGFLHADGRRMVNGCGEEVLLRGWGMGNWKQSGRLHAEEAAISIFPKMEKSNIWAGWTGAGLWI